MGRVVASKHVYILLLLLLITFLTLFQGNQKSADIGPCGVHNFGGSIWNLCCRGGEIIILLTSLSDVNSNISPKRKPMLSRLQMSNLYSFVFERRSAL